MLLLWKMICNWSNLGSTSYFWKLKKRKSTRVALEFIFLVSQKCIIYSMLRKKIYQILENTSGSCFCKNSLSPINPFLVNLSPRIWTFFTQCFHLTLVETTKGTLLFWCNQGVWIRNIDRNRFSKVKHEMSIEASQLQKQQANCHFSMLKTLNLWQKTSRGWKK